MPLRTDALTADTDPGATLKDRPRPSFGSHPAPGHNADLGASWNGLNLAPTSPCPNHNKLNANSSFLPTICLSKSFFTLKTNCHGVFHQPPRRGSSAQTASLRDPPQHPQNPRRKLEHILVSFSTKLDALMNFDWSGTAHEVRQWLGDWWSGLEMFFCCFSLEIW